MSFIAFIWRRIQYNVFKVLDYLMKPQDVVFLSGGYVVLIGWCHTSFCKLRNSVTEINI